MKNELYLYNPLLVKDSEINMWMCFPSIYSFSLSSLGYLWIFKDFDEIDNVFVERVCSDTKNTKISADKLDLMGFSFSFDFDFLSIFKMLEQHKIPLKSKDRTNEMPFIFAGGPVVTSNPVPYNEFFDFFIIGDSENLNFKLIDTIKRNKNTSKQKTLKELSMIDGVYVPGISQSVKKNTSNLERCIYSPILSEDAFFKNTFIVEITRGCSNCCAFCIASYLNLPQRYIDSNEIIRVLELGLMYTNKIALLGANVCAHPDFDKICRFIIDKIDSGETIEMSISSLRADKISPLTIEMLVKAGQKTATIAIEAGSERLRKVINKNLTEEQLYETIKIAKDNGLKGFKVYGMFGLPTETQEDLNEFINLAKRLKTDFKGFDLSYSFSTFVPKAHTPFQWCGREDSKSLEKKQNFLKKEFHKLGLGARFSSIKWDYMQAVLSRGDKNLADYIVDVYKNGAKLGAFKKSANLGLNLDDYALRNFDLNEELPWDFISVKPEKDSLIKEYKRLLQ